MSENPIEKTIEKTMKVKIKSDGEITKYNCIGLCQELYCDKLYTHFVKLEINDMPIVLGFCEEHFEEWRRKWKRNKIKVEDYL